MGTNYVLQKPYDMAQTYEETSPATPMFFVLFPGVDPTPWVEGLARTLDITTENGEHAHTQGGSVRLPPSRSFFTNGSHLSFICWDVVYLLGLLSCTPRAHYTNSFETRHLLGVLSWMPCFTGKFINISMGQGQERPAEGVVER